MKRLSIVICNYNYEEFVATAIASALGVEWPDLEVVVVDDGSTDGSLDVIGEFAGRIKIIATSNARQREAANRGFAESTGDVVVFLDSDDVLPADLAAKLAPVWSDLVSKAQFSVQRIDRTGVEIGQVFPSFDRVPTPAEMRRWMSTTSAYPTPPGSGNAYARWFLDALMPVDASVGDAADSALLAAAPLLGEVVVVPDVVVSYRQHGQNDSNLLLQPGRFGREVARARERWRYACRVSTRPYDTSPLFRSRELLQLRVAAVRADGSVELEGDGRLRMALDTLRSPWQPGPEPVVKRLAVAAFSLAVLVGPRRLVSRLLEVRYGRTRR